MAIYRVTMSCLVAGQTCQNVIHIDDNATATTEAAISTAILSHWLPNILPFQHTSAVWQRIEVRRVSPVGPAPHVQTIILPGTGTGVNDADNSMVGRMLQFKTTVAGKHGRGRLYIPGTSISAFQQGIVKAASLAAGAPLVGELRAQWCDPGPLTGFSLVISQKANPGATLKVSDIVQAVTARALRRRQIGVGI